jgi:hypothetical protein
MSIHINNERIDFGSHSIGFELRKRARGESVDNWAAVDNRGRASSQQVIA